MWQDIVFMIGSGLSVIFLAPTLRDSTARVPLGTSLPSMSIGAVYAFTFGTMGMTFSAAGAAASGAMWSLIALFRSPTARRWRRRIRREFALFADDVRRWADRLAGSRRVEDQYVLDSGPAEESVLDPNGD